MNVATAPVLILAGGTGGHIFPGLAVAQALRERDVAAGLEVWLLPERRIAKPGEIVWSRIFVEGGKLKMDLGRAKVITLPRAETERRWKETTEQWPIMHAVTYGVSRDQMMAKHQANHIQCVYAKNAKDADQALLAKASMAAALGHVAPPPPEPAPNVSTASFIVAITSGSWPMPR